MFALPRWKFFITLTKEQWGLLAIGVLGLCSLIIGGTVFWYALSAQPISVISSESSLKDACFGLPVGLESEKKIVVDVAGAVVHPGIYDLSRGSRVQDAVLMAGGFQAKVNTSYIHQQLNLAAVIADQEKIYIPFQGETVSSAHELSSKTASININTAAQAALEELDGIGEKKAQTIMSGRPYSNRQDFVARSGVGEEGLTKIEQKDVVITF